MEASPATRARVPDTDEYRCHCRRTFDGSDHCPFCGCEQYERYCNAFYPAGKPPTQSWMPGDRVTRYVTH